MDFNTGLFRRPTKSWSTHQLNSMHTEASQRLTQQHEARLNIEPLNSCTKKTRIIRRRSAENAGLTYFQHRSCWNASLADDRSYYYVHLIELEIGHRPFKASKLTLLRCSLVCRKLIIIGKMCFTVECDNITFFRRFYRAEIYLRPPSLCSSLCHCIFPRKTNLQCFKFWVSYQIVISGSVERMDE